MTPTRQHLMASLTTFTVLMPCHSLRAEAPVGTAVVERTKDDFAAVQVAPLAGGIIAAGSTVLGPLAYLAVARALRSEAFETLSSRVPFLGRARA